MLELLENIKLAENLLHHLKLLPKNQMVVDEPYFPKTLDVPGYSTPSKWVRHLLNRFVAGLSSSESEGTEGIPVVDSADGIPQQAKPI